VGEHLRECQRANFFKVSLPPPFGRIFYANLRSATNPYAARAETEHHRKTDIVEAPDQAGGNHGADRAGGKNKAARMVQRLRIWISPMP
jgi:hypothetical protein